MYDKYSFVLEWDDLSEDLRDSKVESFIQSNLENGGYNNPEGEPKASLDELLNDDSIREAAYNAIVAHFPIYF